MIPNLPEYALGAALLASLAFGAVQCSQKQTARTDAAKARSEQAVYEASIAKERARFEAEARATEQRYAADMARIGRDYEEDKAAAVEAANRTVAGLRDGSLRLRQQWQACTRANVSEAGSDPEGVDDAQGLRERDIGSVHGIVAACQAERDALLRIAESDRGIGRE